MLRTSMRGASGSGSALKLIGALAGQLANGVLLTGRLDSQLSNLKVVAQKVQDGVLPHAVPGNASQSQGVPTRKALDK